MGPHPAVAAIRLAVRRALLAIVHPDHDPGLNRPAGLPAAWTPGAAPRPDAAPAAAKALASGGPAPGGSEFGGAEPGPGAAAASAPVSVSGGRASGPALGAAAGPVPGARDGRQPPLVLAACSGGADSTALAAALAFEAPRLGLRAGAVTVDHGLQPGSAERAREVADRLTALGLDPVDVVAVTVGRDGGPEAAARTARYAALDAAAERHGAVAVLLGHTRDDQAETVLLGLARGSGTRSLAGMPPATDGPSGPGGPGGAAEGAGPAGAGLPAGRSAPFGGPGRRYRRPFLTVDRATVRRACAEQSLTVWDDPHNSDPAYTRSRLRHEALPVLEKALGRGVTEALARTAQLARDDADALDAWAAQAERLATRPDGTLDVAALHALPPAVRRRVLRRAAIAAGAPAGSLFARHIEETDRLITAWHGQRPLNLPGRVEARRQGGRLVLEQANR